MFTVYMCLLEIKSHFLIQQSFLYLSESYRCFYEQKETKPRVYENKINYVWVAVRGNFWIFGSMPV